MLAVKAQLSGSDSVIMTEVRFVLHDLISKVVDGIALKGVRKFYRQFSTKDKRLLVEMFHKLATDQPVPNLSVC